MHRRLRRVRVVTLVVLATNAAAAWFMPAIGLGREPDQARVVWGLTGVVLFAVAQAVVLWALVTPWISERARRRSIVVFAGASLVSVPLVGPLGGSWPSWAWLAACIVGIVPVLTGKVAAALLCTLVAVISVVISPGSVVDTLLITVGFGSGIAAINGLHVWFWDLLLQAEEGRSAQAQLAATEERLRFARDVHDLLGHRLSVIALKAELAERLAPSDAGRAGAEAAEVRRIAATALTELREVVHGYREVDLREQVSAIERVLVSSGVRCTVTTPAGELPGPGAAVLAAVLREASTNLLRHSAATWCTIDVEDSAGGVRLTVVNDGAGAATPDAHSHGLRGLAERLAEHGGQLRTRAADGTFTVEAVVRSTP
jgi:two-component system sensor histidine kinase DesK